MQLVVVYYDRETTGCLQFNFVTIKIGETNVFSGNTHRIHALNYKMVLRKTAQTDKKGGAKI